jgi:hypothetical protein
VWRSRAPSWEALAIAAKVRSLFEERGGALRGVDGPRLVGGGGGGGVVAMAAQSMGRERFTGLGEKKHFIPCRREWRLCNAPWCCSLYSSCIYRVQGRRLGRTCTRGRSARRASTGVTESARTAVSYN